jgi:NitT/TauT family transport system substrate-binding protein
MNPFRLLVALCALVTSVSCFAQAKKEFTLVDSVYAGWMPWYYADSSGILKKWADKEGIVIKVVHAANYSASIEAYSPGSADALAITSMDVLMAPAIAGIKSTAVIVGDYSNGNDVLYGRKGKIGTIAALKGQKVHGVTASVSEYVVGRALDKAGLKSSDVEMAMLEETSIAPAFTEGRVNAVVTWAPFTLDVEQDPKAVKLFDSSMIPGEILDLMVVKSSIIDANPAFGRALANAWYEVLAIMNKRGPEARAAKELMAKMSECTLPKYEAQLRTTAMFWSPDSAVSFTAGSEIKAATDNMRKFLFAKGFLGAEAKSTDHFGISFPDGSVLGNSKNIRLVYTTKFMEGAKK